MSLTDPSNTAGTTAAVSCPRDRLFALLSEKGQIFMPLGDYGFSSRFGWVGDRFGITWQLNIP